MFNRGSASPSSLSGSQEKKRKTSDDYSDDEEMDDDHKRAKLLPEEDHANVDTDSAGLRGHPDSFSSYGRNEGKATAPSLKSSHQATKSSGVDSDDDTPNDKTPYKGQARLTRGDDPHRLSEADCFIRQELVEVFTARREDLDSHGDPEIGQVGVRCLFCVQNKDLRDRSKAHVAFPTSLGTLQGAVSDLQRR